MTMGAGCTVDTIQEVYKLGQPGVLSISRERQEAVKSIVFKHQGYPTNEPLEDVFWRLLIADQARVGPGDTGGRAMTAFGDLYLDPGVPTFAFGDEGLTSEGSLAAAQSAYIEMMVLQELVHLCRTEKGYFGWALPGIEAGDQICIFRGFKAPWVLRPKFDTRYELKGSAYIHGIMDCKAVTWDNTVWKEMQIC
jgi:hypothetical protein